MDSLQEKIKSWNYGQEIKVHDSSNDERLSRIDINPSSVPSPREGGDTIASIMNDVALKSSSNYYNIKTTLHQKVLSRLNLSAAETMSRTQLSDELRN